ncbi:MAG: JAB domain-containing protein, partial [Spirochaetaceae bacterium]
MKSGERLEPVVIERMREAIEDAEGHEVLFVGSFGENGLVDEIHEAARGDESAAPALYPFMEKGEVVLHNHPSGLLKPSSADMQVAGRLGNQGVGFYLVDNDVSRIYCVSEPVSTKQETPLNMEECAGYLLLGGRLSRIFPDYEARDVQVEMLEAAVRAFNDRLYAVVEAGTGVGKYLAYLLPSAKWAVENEERVI